MAFKVFHRILAIAALAVLSSALSWADSYCPKTGERFLFYPVSSVYKQVIKGYDCFYAPDAFDEGQTHTAREYRFRVDANGFTPYAEIEGHTFVIENAFKENAEKPVSQQNFICFLIRDDGERLLLRIPFVRKPTDNTLTRGMTLVLNEKNSFHKGPSLCLINIPACPVSQLDKLSEQLKGQTLSRQTDHEVDMTVSALVKYLNKDLGDEIVRSSSVYCDSIVFADVKGYVFRQPIAFGKLKDRKIKLPVFDFRGNGESIYGSYFSINTVFRAPVVEKPLLVENPPLPIQEDTIIQRPPIVEDAPEETNLWVLDVKPKEVVAKKPVQEKTILAEAKPEDEKKPARIIAEGKVRIGFTPAVCKEILGEPDYINTTQNMYTTLEQWVYGHDLYLYFQNGKLKSIEQF